MRILSLILLLLCCCFASACANLQDDNYTLYLVRHSEKQADGSHDPALSGTGRNRSEQLANWFQDTDIEDIWSSDYRRSRDTAAPLLSTLGLELKLYDPLDLPALVSELLENRNNAVIVGHSNTTPELARLLCHCVIADMDESEYDRLIVVSINGDETKVETLAQTSLFQR